jgi:glycosyltransferase involved in cell wall biosynthesis
MTIHFFTFSDRVQPSSRQRTFLTSEELERRGYSVIIHMPTVLSIALTPWPKKFVLILQTIRSLFSIQRDDIIYLQRAVYSKYFFLIMVIYLAIFRRKMIFDFDDPVYVHTPFKTKVFSKIANAVIVSTHGQLAWARQFNKNVRYIHFAIDPTLYIAYEKDYTVAPEVPVIGWLGTGPEHLHNLVLLIPVLRRLAGKVPFTFTLIGSFNDQRVLRLFDNIPDLDIRFIDRLAYTDAEAAPKEVQKFDIGVLPHQSEGEWNKGKTSMKVLEYMAAAVPPVASAFGEMPHIVRDGENGFLASSEDEWVDKLTALIGDPALRKRLGKAGQKTVVENFSLAGAVTAVEDVIRTLR